MRKVFKLAVCVIVPFIANGIAFAGPCEEGCVYNNTQCTTQANTNYSQCTAASNNAVTSCYTEADNSHSSCMGTAYYQFFTCLLSVHQQEQSICNSLLWMDEMICDAAREQAYTNCFQAGSGQGACDFNFQQDQQFCANDYDNCLFVCSVQNP